MPESGDPRERDAKAVGWNPRPELAQGSKGRATAQAAYGLFVLGGRGDGEFFARMLNSTLEAVRQAAQRG